MRFPFDLKSDKNLIRLLTLTGMLLAIWVIALLHGRINNDATLYLEMARRFSVGDTQGALALYNWPLFPWLMGEVHEAAGLSLQYAAHLLNVAFFGIATWSFLTLIREYGGSRATLLSGAVPLAYIILIFAAFHLAGLYQTWYRNRASISWRRKMAFAALAVMLGLFMLNNDIQRGTYPDHEQMAAAWIKQNIASDTRIYFDEARMRYYAGAAWDGRNTSWGGLMAFAPIRGLTIIWCCTSSTSIRKQNWHCWQKCANIGQFSSSPQRMGTMS